MLDVIEKLLRLQERDRKIARTQAEVSNIGPERTAIQNRLANTQQKLDAAKLKVKQIESDRKELELEVDAKKQQIEKYSIQQFQTKKNEEYKALANEIEGCKAVIVQLEDQQLALMELGDAAQKEAAAAQAEFNQAKSQIEAQIADLAAKEENLKKQLVELQSNYEELTSVIDESVLDRYERLRRHKGENTVVGIEHSVCGGCHMKLPTHIVIACQGQRELVSCPNCGRLLYYAPYMDLAVVD